jgi:hypothetical protein
VQPDPRARRPSSFRPLLVIGVAVALALACDLGLRWSAARPGATGAMPATWLVDYTVTFLDAFTKRPVPGVQVRRDLYTSKFVYEWPSEWIPADPQGRWTAAATIEVSLRRAKGTNAYEGLVVYDPRRVYRARASGYQDLTLNEYELFGPTRWVKVGPNQRLARSLTVLMTPPAGPPAFSGTTP